MKNAMTVPRPRNPLVAAAKFRRAGSHGLGESSKRQRAAAALRQELTTRKYSP